MSAEDRRAARSDTDPSTALIELAAQLRLIADQMNETADRLREELTEDDDAREAAGGS